MSTKDTRRSSAFAPYAKKHAPNGKKQHGLQPSSTSKNVPNKPYAPSVDPSMCTYKPCVDATCIKNHAEKQRLLVCPECNFPPCKYGAKCTPPENRAHAFCHRYA